MLDPSVWTNCYGEHDTSGFAGALENAMGIGFTFGGQNFFGHGVYLSQRQRDVQSGQLYRALREQGRLVG